jgi:hypothetical protein
VPAHRGRAGQLRPLLHPPYVCDSRSLLRNGSYAKPTKFWSDIQRRAEELLEDAHPARNYVMTEVVHCKSQKNAGTAAAAGKCAAEYLKDIMQLTAAPIVVVVGEIAKGIIRAWFPDLPRPPEIHPRAELGGRERTFLFIGQPGSNKPSVLSRPDLYATRLAELRAIARTG